MARLLFQFAHKDVNSNILLLRQVIFNSQRIPNSAFEINNGQVTAFHQDVHQMSGSDDDENVVIIEDRDLPEKYWNIGDREVSEHSLPSSFE